MNSKNAINDEADQLKYSPSSQRQSKGISSETWIATIGFRSLVTPSGTSDSRGIGIRDRSGVPKPTGLLTPSGVLTRESESFARFFRGPNTTLKVGFAPRKIVFETERFSDGADSSQRLAKKGETQKRREESLSAFCVNSWAPQITR